MRRAPHLIHPLKFILPYEKHLRPAWLIRIGLFLYDHLANRQFLPKSQFIKIKNSILTDEIQSGFSYYDCFADDSRLVIANALSASENGATILNYSELISAVSEEKYWKITIKDFFKKETRFFYSKVLINTSGPWINETQKKINPSKQFPIQLVQGSHIVVNKLYEEKHAYILQNTDERIIFTIPFQNQFTLIGTTDRSVTSSLDHIEVNPDEINYLCSIINHYFRKKISSQDVIWKFSGVRCLQAESEKLAKITREYKLDLSLENALPLLTVIGGKLTTHRILAEDALKLLKIYFPHMKSYSTNTKPLPGGDIPNSHFMDFYLNLQKIFSWLPPDLLLRYAKNYGTYVYQLLDKKNSIADLGQPFGAGLFECEIDYLKKQEWAKTKDDILWRRTKLGLWLNQDNLKFSQWI